MDKKSGVAEKVQIHPTAEVLPTAEIGFHLHRLGQRNPLRGCQAGLCGY